MEIVLHIALNPFMMDVIYIMKILRPNENTETT